MVRYYGRARQRIGSVNTNQPGLKQAGCPGTVGKKGLIIRYLGKRVNCNLKTCGLPMSGLRCRYGVGDAIGRDKTFMDIQNSNNPAIKDYCKEVIGGQNGVYCQWPQPRNRQNAGGVGNIWTSRRNHCEKTCALGWKENYMLNHTPKEFVQQVERAAASWCDGGKGITCLTVGVQTEIDGTIVYGYSDGVVSTGSHIPFGDVNTNKISLGVLGDEAILHSLEVELESATPGACTGQLEACSAAPAQANQAACSAVYGGQCVWTPATAPTSSLVVMLALSAAPPPPPASPAISITFLNVDGETMSVTALYLGADSALLPPGVFVFQPQFPTPTNVYNFLKASEGQTLQVNWQALGS